MNIDFRMGEMEDLKEIGMLVQQSIAHMIQCNINQWDDLYPSEEDFRIDIEKNQLFVGTIDGEIAVVYVLNQECDEAYENGEWEYKDPTFYVIHRVCVKPSFQNCGVAKRVMAYVEKQVLLWGGQSIRLDVFSENPYALKLYEACGYNRVGEANWRKGKFYLMEKYLDKN